MNTVINKLNNNETHLNDELAGPALLCPNQEDKDKLGRQNNADDRFDFHVLYKQRIQYLRSKNFTRFLDTYVNDSRPEGFFGVADILPPELYWRELRNAWSRALYLGVSSAKWAKLFNDPRPCRSDLMTPTEQSCLASLPEKFTVFNGYYRNGDNRWLSWTMDSGMGIYLAAVDGGFASAQCRKEDIVALFVCGDMRHHEIIVDPNRLFSLRHIRVDKPS